MRYCQNIAFVRLNISTFSSTALNKIKDFHGLILSIKPKFKASYHLGCKNFKLEGLLISYRYYSNYYIEYCKPQFLV